MQFHKYIAVGTACAVLGGGVGLLLAQWALSLAPVPAPLVQLFALITHRRLRMNTNERVHQPVPI